MTLNKQGPGKIEWTDWTWNPVTGCYGPGGNVDAPALCDYCFANETASRYKGGKAFPEGFKPQFREKYLDDFNYGKGLSLPSSTKIFVSDMGDLFGSWVPYEWIDRVVDVAQANDHLIFQFLTKNPERYDEVGFPKNCWLGTTVDGLKATEWNIDILLHGNEHKNIKFVSFEPLLDLPWNLTHFGELDWIIIGAQTGKHPKPAKPEFVKYLLGLSGRYDIPVFLKSNLNWPEKFQEYPEVK